jgi:hypothetical protein
MGTIRIPVHKKNPGKGAGIRSARPGEGKGKAMKKRDY